MIKELQHLLAIHSLSLVLTAIVVCTVAAAIVVALLARTDTLTGRNRLVWMARIAIVMGMGVWTTHFIAMLGYCPDFALDYEPISTFLSAVVSIVLVGGPIAATVLVRRRWMKAGLGAVSGAGVAATHFTGMSALQGCLISYDLGTSAAALLAVIAAFAAAMAAGPTRSGRVARIVLIVVGLLALHFTSIAGTSLHLLPSGSVWGADRATLSALGASASLLLSMAVMLVTVRAARLNGASTAAAKAEAARLRVLSVALNNMSNGLVMVDPDGLISVYNQRVVGLLGLDADDVAVGMPLATYLANIGRHKGWNAKRIAGVVANHLAWLENNETTHVEHHFDGGPVLSVACRPMAGGGCVLTYEDVTERRLAEAKVTHMAFHDALTGLPNRRMFAEQAHRLLQLPQRFSMLMLDLDRFKQVNDTLGHAIGDALLVEVSARMRQKCRRSDLMFRLGGDEFAILPQPDAGVSVDDLAHRVILALAVPFFIKGHTISIGCSIGIATSYAGADQTHMVQMADLALYRAKELGRSRAEHYESGMIEKARARRQTEIDLIRAIRENEFELHYQPFRSLPDNRLLGFEALIRWNHPTRGLVSPAEFIPLAEENGMICQIGTWVLNEACRTAACWPDPLFVAINVSAVQMRTPEITSLVAKILREHGLAASKLELELTETAMVKDGVQIATVLRELRALGVRIAMDDFGTGYSSLTHLRDFELDRIKIDKSFIGTTSDDIGARAVVRAVTGLARDLSITTTAEGVETQEQLSRLTELGCDAVQGYLLGRPVDSKAVAKAIAMETVKGIDPPAKNRTVTQAAM